jgi:predicted nucleic acid-binding Zn ribbon protein
MTHCIACGTLLVGRNDKRFCDDACRSGYHNSQGREQNGFILHINKILKRNRKILIDLYNRNLPVVPIQKLQENGFLFGFCTSIEVIRKKERTRYCYEYGYTITSRKFVKIVKQGQ